jgi:hypothetical protein
MDGKEQQQPQQSTSLFPARSIPPCVYMCVCVCVRRYLQVDDYRWWPVSRSIRHWDPLGGRGSSSSSHSLWRCRGSPTSPEIRLYDLDIVVCVYYRLDIITQRPYIYWYVYTFLAVGKRVVVVPKSHNTSRWQDDSRAFFFSFPFPWFLMYFYFILRTAIRIQSKKNNNNNRRSIPWRLRNPSGWNTLCCIGEMFEVAHKSRWLDDCRRREKKTK